MPPLVDRPPALRPSRRGVVPLRTAIAASTCALVVGCVGRPEDPWAPPGGRAGETAVYEATARHFVEHYGPDPARDEALGAVCLTAGRRHTVPVRQQERGEEWDPDGELLRRLTGLAHPVVPVSECRWDEGLEEVHVPSGRPAAVLALSFPDWESESIVWVDVVTRESARWRFRYRCHLTWRVEGWTVRSCL